MNKQFIHMKKSFIIVLTILAATLCSEARQPQEGYRGFFEFGSNICSENYGYLAGNSMYVYSETNYYLGASTTHGYQLNTHVFIGAGLSLEYSPNEDNWIIPLYADCRYDMQFGKFTPYFDVRLGANFAEGVALYFSPTVGYRFNFGRKLGLNVGAGLTLAGYKAEHYEGIYTGPNDYDFYYTGTQHKVRPCFALRLGIDF